MQMEWFSRGWAVRVLCQAMASAKPSSSCSTSCTMKDWQHFCHWSWASGRRIVLGPSWSEVSLSWGKSMTVWVLWAVQELWDGCFHSVWYSGCAELKGNPSWVLLWIRATLPTFILNQFNWQVYKCCPSVWASDIHPLKWVMQWLSETVA